MVTLATEFFANIIPYWLVILLTLKMQKQASIDLAYKNCHSVANLWMHFVKSVLLAQTYLVENHKKKSSSDVLC